MRRPMMELLFARLPPGLQGLAMRQLGHNKLYCFVMRRPMMELMFARLP